MSKLPVLLPSRFRVIRRQEAVDGAHFLQVSFPKASGGKGSVIIPRGLLYETAKARVLFANQGANLPTDCRALFDELLEQEAPLVRLVAKTGWHRGTFVSRFGCIGASDTGEVELHATATGSRERSVQGDAETFKATIAPLLTASPFLLLAYIAALTAPLGARIGITNGFAMCFSAESSTGKTTCLRLAHSLVSRADEADLENFGNTDGILLDSLPLYGGQAISFGDLKADIYGKGIAQKLRSLVFAATGGAIRQRKGEELRPIPAFNILMFSAETPMHELFAASGIPFEDGEAVRLLDVPVPCRARGGIFADAQVPPAQLITNVEALLREHHGVVIDEWINTLSLKKLKTLELLVRVRRKHFVKQLGSLPAHQTRIAEHFGVLAAAGTIAARSGVLPIPVDVTHQALVQLFRSVVDRMASRDTQIVEAWTAFLSLIDRLPVREEGQAAASPDLAGFRRSSGATTETVYVRRDALINLVGEATFSAIILPGLIRAGCLPAKGEKTVPIKQAGLHRARYFRISSRSLVTLREQLAPILSAAGV